MFPEKTKNINNLIMIDFSIIKNKSKKKYNIENKYYIWPYNENVLLEYIPPYSICINGLELIFGKEDINNNLHYKNTIDICLKKLKNIDEKIYELFLNGLTLKIETKDLLDLINKFFND